MSCSTEVIQLMHKYLDEEITSEEESKLREHLNQCEECTQHFHELKKSIAFVQSTSHISAPSDFTMKVMQNLPKEKKVVRITRWLGSHPMITAASLFILLMTGSLFSVWEGNQEFSVSKQPNLVIENNTVIVPEGEVVKGDVLVRNGTLHIEGKVDGDVTVINGERYLAAAGEVSGEIKVIDEMFEWLWFQIKTTTKDALHLFDNDKNEAE